jgi:hypothetical protein
MILLDRYDRRALARRNRAIRQLSIEAAIRRRFAVSVCAPYGITAATENRHNNVTTKCATSDAIRRMIEAMGRRRERS